MQNWGRFTASPCLILVIIALFYIVVLVGAGKNPCKDRFAECAEHADDCISNPGYMVLNCPKTCKLCHLRNPAKRCSPKFLNISTEPVLKSGDIDTMFKLLVSSHEKVHILSSDPWLIEIDDFLSPSTVDQLLSHVIRWEQSAESGAIGINGEGEKLTTTTRTSSTFWCNFADCKNSAVSAEIRQRIQEVLGIDQRHYEPVQLLKYEVGQSFVAHHDFSYQELALPCGPRVLTFFLYLSDLPDDAGGETVFPELKVSVTSKLGKALLWPNTLSANPFAKDTRMVHEAHAVRSGVKYAANVWVHLLEWERPALWACTGS